MYCVTMGILTTDLPKDSAIIANLAEQHTYDMLDSKIWRDVQLSNSTKLLPMPSGYPQDITGDPINVRNSRW